MKKIKIGVVGCGGIGEGVALFIDKQLKNKAVLTALSDMQIEKAYALREMLTTTPFICDIDRLIKEVDLVVETASVSAAWEVLQKALSYKKDVIILSVGALMRDLSLLQKAEKRGVTIYIPSGAICGVDAVCALSLGKIRKISLITSKPPAGLLGADYLIKKKINIKKLRKEKVIFRGSVKEAIKYFPQNINVAVTLLLASSFSGLGAKEVEVCIKADPRITRNIHNIVVDAQEAKINICIENIPSKLNPKTSTLAILSTQHLLKKIFSSIKIGS